jgi:CelD/BcsL family acetyltransferase involved in cellulose biosynthesis
VAPPSSGKQKSLSVTIADADALSVADLSGWDELVRTQRDRVNPFLTPEWVQSWYAAYVPPADQVLILVHDPAGNLVGVAPLYVQHVGPARLRMGSRLLPVGAGVGPNPFEMPGMLTSAQTPREVTRAVVAFTLGLDVDWCELALAQWQGWFEPEWVYAVDNPVTFSEFQRPRACVILEVGDTWEQTKTTLKRNLKESIRRSHNRIAKDGRSWKVMHHIDEVEPEVIDRFLELHRFRSETERSTVHHPDAYADGRSRDLVRAAIPRLAARGLASVFELVVEDVVIASQLVLHSEGCSYVHSSGMRPDEWALGPVTLLQTELVKYAVERHDRIVNFSPGPNVSKLRWSEKLYVSHEFAYGSGRHALQLRYGAYQVLSSLRANASAIAFVRRNASRPGAGG